MGPSRLVVLLASDAEVMDCTKDEWMAMFTDGQAERMSDAWLALRVGTTRGCQ